MSFAQGKSFISWMESGTSTASVAMFRMPLMDISMIRRGDDDKKKKSSKLDKKDKDE